MELIERYLNEVGRRLPKDKREDICDELRSTLDDTLEDRTIGDPTESDVVAVLNELGSPQAVAASYSGNRYLIGPELYGPFLTTLRIVFTVLAGLVVLGSAISVFTSVGTFSGFTTTMAGMVNSIIDSFITALGIVVVIFFLIERMDLRLELGDKKKPWNPLQLPAVNDVDLIGRFDSIAGVVFPAIVLVLMNQFKDRIGLQLSGNDGGFSIGILGQPEGELLLNDEFLELLPWLNVSLLLPMALAVWQFWSGRWNLPTRLLKIAFDVFGLYVFIRVCRALTGVGPQLAEAGVPVKVTEIGGVILEFAPYVVAAIVVIDAVKHLYRAFKSTVAPSPRSA